MSNKKINITPELMQRLKSASMNGSTIATRILSELKKPRQGVLSSSLADNFGSKRYVQHRDDIGKTFILKISYSMKDFTNPHNPDCGDPSGGERPNNRVFVTPSQFALMFNDINNNHEQKDLDYFESAILSTSKVTIKIEDSYSAFRDAYLGSNYSVLSEKCSTLHNSCMRHEQTSQNAADFYKNFAGVKIMVAYNGDREIVGRAIVWPSVDVIHNGSTVELSFLDRKYFAYSFVRELMKAKAKEVGIDLIKAHDEICQELKVIATKDIPAIDVREGEAISAFMNSKVPKVKWHKSGAPYLDTFISLFYRDGNFVLGNTIDGGNDDEVRLASFHSTSGYASYGGFICAKCGTPISCSSYRNCNDTSDKKVKLCNDCFDEVFTQTDMGPCCKGKTKKIKGFVLPSAVADSPHCLTAISLTRLFED